MHPSSPFQVLYSAHHSVIGRTLLSGECGGAVHIMHTRQWNKVSLTVSRSPCGEDRLAQRVKRGGSAKEDKVHNAWLLHLAVKLFYWRCQIASALLLKISGISLNRNFVRADDAIHDSEENAPASLNWLQNSRKKLQLHTMTPNHLKSKYESVTRSPCIYWKWAVGARNRHTNSFTACLLQLRPKA